MNMSFVSKRYLSIVKYLLTLTPGLVLMPLAVLADSLDEPTSFAIDAQALDTALIEFSEQADIQLVVRGELVVGLESDGLTGEFTPRIALAALLDDTGLTYSAIGEDSVAVAADPRGASDSKNLNPAPILMAQNTSSQTQTTISSRSEEGGTSIVTGKVTDARTGANLKGAKVTIEETGQWTSTNDLGEFRFVNVPAGSVTLTVSFLGYAGQSTVIGVRGRAVAHDFALRGGSEVEEIVVFGQRSARALALNQERTAENFMTVVSSDILGQFDGTTISEALRRAPGVAFEVDTLSGIGTNVIVRGLEPGLNSVTLNGVRLPEATGTGRAANLGNILTESISQVTISKTLLPSQDSAATGALIDIETKAPLDRPERYLSLGVEKGATSDDFVDGIQASGTGAITLGADDQFGLSASVQYRNRDVKTASYFITPVFGQYLPIADDGTLVSSLSQIDPRAHFPFEEGADEVYSSQTGNGLNIGALQNLSTTLSAQWLIGNHTDLRLDWHRSTEERDQYFRNQTLVVPTGYRQLPVESLGREERFALVWEDFFPFARGVMLPLQAYSTEKNREETTDTINLAGETTYGNWQFDYTLGFTKGEQDVPAQFNLTTRVPAFGVDFAFLHPDALANTVDGRVVSLFAPRSGRGMPLPLLNSEGFAYYNDAQNYVLGSMSMQSRTGSNERDTADISAKYDFGGRVAKYLQIGAFYESAKFSNHLRVLDNYSATFPSLDSLGLTFSRDSLESIGQDGGFRVIRRSDLDALIANLPMLIQGDTPLLSVSPVALDPRRVRVFTEENELSTYIQGRVDFGKLEVVGGVRFVAVDIRAVNLTSPIIRDENGIEDEVFSAQFARLVDQSARETDVLPRILLNYRHSDNLVFRGGYFRSVARPKIAQLSDEQTIILDFRPIFGPDRTQPQLSVREGNPALKPATTDSFDLSLEYYTDSVGVVKVSAFYKEISNLFQDNKIVGSDVIDDVVLPDDSRFDNLPGNIFIERIRPVNSDFSSRIWGYEGSLEQQFTTLPGIWGGLGVRANYTYSKSESKEIVEFEDAPGGEIVFSNVPFDRQPRHSGTFALTYNRDRVDASIGYTSQSRRLEFFNEHNLSSYRDRFDTLDLRVNYYFDFLGGQYRAYLIGADLLRSTDEPSFGSSIGGDGATPRVSIGGNFLGGRQFSVGLVGTFE